MQMNSQLKEKLASYGWNAARIEREGVWGEVVSGSVHHITLRDARGVERYHAGPLVTVQAGGQAAIVRWS